MAVLYYECAQEATKTVEENGVKVNLILFV